MSYSRNEFASDIQRILESSANLDHAGVASWAYETRLRHLGAIDPRVSEWLLQLGTMDMGTEFEFTRDELVALAREARKL